MNIIACHEPYLIRIAQAMGMRNANKAEGESPNTPYPLIGQPEVEVIPLNDYQITKSVVQGPMFLETDYWGVGLRQTFDRLIELDADPEVQGHYMSMNTGGGTIDAGQYGHSIMSSLTKPVLVHTNYGCSAGVMTYQSATEVMLVDEMSTVGSVGVLQSWPRWFLEVYNQYFLDLYADTSARKREEFKALTSGNHQPSIESLNQIDKAFMKSVKKNRPNVTSEALSGAVFTGREAIDAGLADSIGNSQNAMRRLSTLIKNQNA